MAEGYFENIRTVGANIDEGITKLQQTWSMPHLVLCKSNEEDQLTAKKLVENLRNELKNLRQTLEEKKEAVTNLRETHLQFLEESTKAIKGLKEEVNDIKVLFAENGYIEDPMENDLSILNSQLESLSVNNSSNSFVRDSNNEIQSSTLDTASSYDSPVNFQSPSTNASFNGKQKSLLSERPMEPLYSPYYYKMMKK